MAVLSLLTLALSVAATPLSTYAGQLGGGRFRGQQPLAPLTVPSGTAPHNIIDDSYIVVLKDNFNSLQLLAHLDELQRHASRDTLFMSDNGGLKHVYDLEGFKGYAGSFAEETVHALRSWPEIEYIERDSVMHTQYDTIQRSAPWGLARISHRKTLSLGTFNRYEYDSDGGEGVNVYIIDTGIFIDHEEFEGRARWGKTMPRDDEDKDGNGHGTHCAGTIASRTYGVAKKANVTAVKVLGSNGSGSTSDVIGGVQWALNDAIAAKKAAEEEVRRTGSTRHKGSVANMSLGGGRSEALDRVVNAAVNGGVHFAVAAGNDNQDACNSSPARAELAVTVGASTLADERAYFSNHGECVDVFAPGLNILSTWNGPGLTNKISGTSMAAPHTAGLMAYLLSIYPSVSFNPPVPGKSMLYEQPTTYESLCSYAHSLFPRWMTIFLPSSPSSMAPVPIPEVPLTPEIMKKAVIALSTKDKLQELPANTVNYLIYNNATGLGAAESGFWNSLF